MIASTARVFAVLPLTVAFASLTLACGGDSTSAGAGGGSTCAPAQAEDKRAITDVHLDVLVQGCGAPMVMLHGFPEFAFTWDGLAAKLEKSFRITRPNQRGYYPSDIPTDVTSYEMKRLVEDAAALIRSTGSEKVIVVSHDWGGVVGWRLAMDHPELLRGFVVMNAPPPGVWAKEIMMDPQKSASGYINVFLMPNAEMLLSSNGYSLLKSSFSGLISPQEEARYVAAWSQPGTLTGGLNWYRANLLPGPVPGPTFVMDEKVTVPTLVLWGDQDSFLLGDVLIPDLTPIVPDLTVQRFPKAGHFLMYQEPDAIVAAIEAFAAKHPPQ